MDDDSVFNDWLDRIPEAGNRRSSRRLSMQSVDFPISILKRKRKRAVDEDSISLSSVDSLDSVSIDEEGVTSSKGSNKPKRRSILRASSLINILSPQKSGSTVGRRSSFKVPNSKAATALFPTPSKAPPPVSPYKPPPPSTPNRRASKTWSDSVASRNSGSLQSLSRQDIKRQEAIFELWQGEKDLMDDLLNVQKLYRDPMTTLRLVTADEAYQIFGPIDQLIPVHQDLATRLEACKQESGMFAAVGEDILQWVPQLVTYKDFCANQIAAKATLDSKRLNASVQDYLLRCQESSFSRKLDLWAILDGARGRFMKYPLLIRSILKETPDEVEDVSSLLKALTRLDSIIKEADHMTGQAECKFYKAQLTAVYDEQFIPEIENSTELICQGILKNNKGSKLQIFLFDKVAVVTRCVANGYQIYRMPIPVSQLVVEDLADGSVRMGSFRNAFGQGQTSKNLFRISFTDQSQGQSHTLMASDEHAKQKWMRSFQSVTSHIVRLGAGTTEKR